MWGAAELRVPLLMMAIIGTLAYEFQVVLPVVASETFAGDARAYGFLTAAIKRVADAMEMRGLYP